MIDSIARFRQTVQAHQLVPIIALATTFHAADPVRRPTGYGGVLPVPSHTSATPANATHLDSLVALQRRDARTERGRVLYADGRTEHVTSAAAVPSHAQPHRRLCPEQRVGQTHTPSILPNS
jgi:hypothetical protein